MAAPSRRNSSPQAVTPELPGRFIRATFVASNLRHGGTGYYSENEWSDAKVSLLLRIDLRLSDGAEIESLTLFTADDVPGFTSELPTCTTILPIELDESVVGFRMHELKTATRNSVYFHAHVLLSAGDGLRLEPLSRELFKYPYAFPGRELRLQSSGQPVEVARLRAFAGVRRHHVMGLEFARSSSLEAATGQRAAFWLDLVGFILFPYYLDVFTDVQQVVLFAMERQFDYLALTCVGIFLPIATSLIVAVQWSESRQPEPQSDIFRSLVPSRAMRLWLLVASVLTQSHMLVLVLASALFRVKHDLLLASKHAEVAEAAVSACVQGNFLLLAVVGVKSVSPEALRGLAFSVSISCLSLGFGLASRDKLETRVLEVPGKLAWGPVFLTLCLVRTLEVASRILAINIVHLSVRAALPLGGPATVLLLAVVARCLFWEADRQSCGVSMQFCSANHDFIGVHHVGVVLRPNYAPLMNNWAGHRFLLQWWPTRVRSFWGINLGCHSASQFGCTRSWRALQ